MKNRLQYLLGPPVDAFFNDLYEVETLGGAFIVSFAIAHAIVRALVTFSHAGVTGNNHVPVTRMPLAPLLTEAAQLSRLGRKDADVTCASHCPEGLQVMGNPQRLEQVFVNLVTNAIDASPRGGRVELFAEEVGELVRVRVVDQGHGIPPELAQRIFEPFFTTKQPGEGTGLGLALVSSIVREHGGTLEVDSQPGAGTTFTVVLPRAMDARAIE